jgi:hypothetical protein
VYVAHDLLGRGIQRRFRRVLHVGSACEHGDVGIASGVDQDPGAQIMHAGLVMHLHASHAVAVGDHPGHRGMQPERNTCFLRHFEQDQLHRVGIERGKRAADARRIGQVPLLARAAAGRDSLDELLREPAHDLLAAAVVKRRDIGERMAGAAEVAGCLD